MDWSVIFSRVRDKQYRMPAIWIAIASGFLLVQLYLLVTAYIHHHSLDEKLTAFAMILVYASLIINDLEKLIKEEQKTFSHAFEFVYVAAMFCTFFLFFIAAIIHDYPNLHIRWTFYPWTNR